MITYSEPGDILYVYLQDEQLLVARTVFLDDCRLVDRAADGAVIGVEFIGVNEGIDLEGVPESDRIRALISRLAVTLQAFAKKED